MGGIADYTEATVCEMPLAVAAGAAVQARTDGLLVCASAQKGRAVRLPASAVIGCTPAQVQRALAGARKWARYPLGCVWWLAGHSSGARRLLCRGATILLDSDVPLGGGVSSSAAIEVATLHALAAMCRVRIKPLALAAAGQVVENRIVGAPCGVMDQVTACLGRAGAMMQIACQPDETSGMPARVLGAVALPRGYAFVGIHSGVRHEVSGDPYTDTRVAAFMAHKILTGRPHELPIGGFLANVDPVRFGTTLWAELPEVMRGRDFLKKYGGTDDAVTAVKPGQRYAVRAAAMHHVWEAQRVRRFMRLLTGAAGGTVALRMQEAGRLMDASHESYGRYARLGHPLTDWLVREVRKLGTGRGFLGAKITGGGCGGTVALLIEDTPVVRKRVASLRRRYTAATGRATMYFEGTGPGAAAVGTAAVDMEGQR
jgi:galactokinase